MKLDFHVHTKYSEDSMVSLDTFAKVCKKQGLFPVITDHDTIKGALEFKKHYGSCLIGEEVHTKQGDVIGLFMNEGIPKGLSVYDAVDRIRQQGALVYMPHPFDVRSSALKVHDFKADIVEVFNGRVVLQKYNQMADSYAEKHGLLKAVGSDSHFARNIGSCYCEMDTFSDIKGFVKSLKHAALVTKSSSPFVLPATNAVYTAKKLFEKVRKISVR